METSLNNLDVVKLNIGGIMFQCYRKTFNTFPDSRLARLDRENKAELFYDRDPSLFACILDSYRKGKIHMSKDICGTTFLQELEFWELSPKHVAPCCWKTLYSSEEDVDTMNQLLQYKLTKSPPVYSNGLRQKLWRFLDQPHSSRMALVSLNIKMKYLIYTIYMYTYINIK